MKELLSLTGYIRGGVTCLQVESYPVYVDETIELFDVVSVSAGTGDYKYYSSLTIICE